MIDVNIRDAVSETLLINIPMKAGESKRSDGILKDPFSVKLIESLDYDFSKFESAERSRKGVVIRARSFDDNTLEFIEQNKDRQLIIVHLGAGLDTRYLRINGKSSPAVFYELDLPEVIDLREKVLPEQENEFMIKASMFDTAWMDELIEKYPGGYFLFVMEGITFYFPEQKIKQLFCDLADRFSGEILCDLINVWLSRNSSKNDVMKNMEAEFVFGIDDELEIADWHSNIQHIKTEHLMKKYKKRWGFLIGQVLSHIPFLKNSSKIVMYRLG